MSKKRRNEPVADLSKRGFIRSARAQEILGVGDRALRNYVQFGHITRYRDPEKPHKVWYRESDVNDLKIRLGSPDFRVYPAR